MRLRQDSSFFKTAATHVPSSFEATDSAAPSTRAAAPMSAEGALIARCGAGDLDAFDEIVAAHQDRVFNLCYWMLGSHDDAADASQDAFVRAWRSLQTFRGDSTFSTWLHRIAVNASLDVMQRRKRAPLPYSDLNPSGESALDDDEVGARHEDASTPHGAREGDPAFVAARGERRNAVRAALAKLPDHYRIALVLFDIEGSSYDEIAHSLNLPLGTIKSRINRARLALRERLESSRELFED
jgi:RNA polymerase sigma-70 factor (ECF subfamily)